MTLHVAILFEYPTLNGGERSMLSVLETLRDRQEFRFTAVAPPEGLLAQALHDRGIPLMPFDTRTVSRSQSELSSIARPPVARDAVRSTILRCCQELNPDILHANSLSMCRVTGPLRTLSAPSLRGTGSLRCTGHIRDIVRLSSAAVRDVNLNDAIVTVSRATRDFHVQQGLDSKRTVVICNGVDSDVFRRRQGPEESSQDQRLPGAALERIPADAFVVLSVGQICLRKGQLDLAEAIVQLQSAEPVRNLHLVIVGERYSNKAESLQYEQDVIHQFDAAGLSNRLHLPGYVPDIRPLMWSANLLVHAARQEPFGRVLLEASACELPIVATAVGGTAELLRHDVDAILIPPSQPAAIAAAIRRTMDEPISTARRAETARGRIQAEFSVLRAANSLAGFWVSSR